jgi:predicted component of type VI protein secretion system
VSLPSLVDTFRDFTFRNFADILNGRMVLLAVFALNVAHPGSVFAEQQKKAIVDPEVKAVHVEGDEVSAV